MTGFTFAALTSTAFIERAGLIFRDRPAVIDGELPLAEQVVLEARQGVGNVVAELLRVVDPSGRDVPADGKTMGEILVR